MLLAITFFEHLWNLFSGIPVEKLLGFVLMVFVLGYMLYVSRRHRKEIWEGIKGTDHKLESSEIVILIVMFLYPIVVLSDVFLGLHASEGVFWSIDAIIFFALTGKVAMNKFGTPQQNQPSKPQEAKPEKEDNSDEPII